MKLMIVAACAAALALSGCVTASKISPEQAGRIAESLVARCGGTFEVEAGANTGQLGGTASASVKARATCPVPRPAPAPAAPSIGVNDTIGGILATPPPADPVTPPN